MLVGGFIGHNPPLLALGLEVVRTVDALNITMKAAVKNKSFAGAIINYSLICKRVDVTLTLNSKAELQIDLDALAANWRTLADLASPSVCSAVVKANAYGLGDFQVVKRLYQEGCRHFFVANVDEAIRLSASFFEEISLYILGGLGELEISECRQRKYIPVLSTKDSVLAWVNANRADNVNLPSVVQVETGMNRLGLSKIETQWLFSEVSAATLNPQMLFSHLACADDVEHPLNSQQLLCFKEFLVSAKQWSPKLSACLANSAGILLGSDYHFDFVRPGIAIYGGNPQIKLANKFKPVVHLRLPVAQIKCLEEDGFVGYGATAKVKSGATLAVVHGGYADGLLRAQSNISEGEMFGRRVPMVGRVSMDLTVFDISSVVNRLAETNEPLFIDVLNSAITIDEVAANAQTIPYEILTSLGGRYSRRYLSV